MKTNGNQWKPMEINENQCSLHEKTMEINENDVLPALSIKNQCKSNEKINGKPMKTNGNQWKPMEINENQCSLHEKTMEINENDVLPAFYQLKIKRWYKSKI